MVAHKAKRFRTEDDPDLTRHEAFLLPDRTTHAIYYRDQIAFDVILERIAGFAPRL